MPIDFDFKVSNYPRVSKAAIALANGQKYRGYIRDAIVNALQDLRSFTASITHVETGTLQSGISWEYDSHTMKGRIYIAQWAIKAVGNTLQWANVYGPFEHRRGGSHAFFGRTMTERAPETFAKELNAVVKDFDF